MKMRSTTLSTNSADIHQSGRYRYKRITSDDAFSMCQDVQLYSYCRGRILPDLWSPSVYRTAFLSNLEVSRRDHHMWGVYDWFVKITDEKPEYEPV